MAKFTLKNIQKELARNKAKSGGLGVMCLVAVYLWGPLLYGWFAPESFEEEVSVNETVHNTAAAPNVATTTNSKATGPRLRWDEIRELMDKDELMKPAEFNSKIGDPFHWFGDEKPELEIIEEVKEPEKVELPTEMSPRELGLVLNSTFVGRVRRIAKINGKQFVEGKEIRFFLGHDKRFADQIASGAFKDTIVFQLTKVDSSHVVLTRDNKEQILTIDVPKFDDLESNGTVNDQAEEPDDSPEPDLENAI